MSDPTIKVMISDASDENIEEVARQLEDLIERYCAAKGATSPIAKVSVMRSFLDDMPDMAAVADLFFEH